MKHNAVLRERRDRGAERVIARCIEKGAQRGHRLKSARPWTVALVLLVFTACGGSGGGGGSDHQNGDPDDPVTVESISLDTESLLLEQNEQGSITATLHLSNGGTASPGSDVNWSVGSENFAKIADKDGTTATLVGKEIGRTTVTAESGGHRVTADVFVTDEVALQVRPAILYIPPECSEKITARLVTAEGVTRDITGDATWSVSNVDAIAVEDRDGGGKSVVARSPDTIPITSVVSASYRNRSATGRVSVGELQSSLGLLYPDGPDVAGTMITLAQGEPRRLEAVGIFKQDAFPDRNMTDCVKWTSENKAAATVSDDGVVTGVAEGSSEVKAEYEGGSSATVTVSVSDVTMHDLSITGDTMLKQGEREQVQANAVISDGTTSDVTSAVDWRSDSPGIVSVSNDRGSEGVMIGVAPGQAVVSAAFSDFEASMTVVVDSNPDQPGYLTLKAEPNVLLASDPGDPAEICAGVVSNDFEAVGNSDVDFLVVEGSGRASLSSVSDLTNSPGETCANLSPENDATAGFVIVRAEESDSGIAETVKVELVSSFASVFDTSATAQTTDRFFEAVLVNGSNRRFTVTPDSLAFCTEKSNPDLNINNPSDLTVNGGGRIRVSVETEGRHDNAAIAIELRAEPPTGEPFTLRHQFGEHDVDCDANTG